jgi:hypothetical protein
MYAYTSGDELPKHIKSHCKENQKYNGRQEKKSLCELHKAIKPSLLSGNLQ